MNKIKGFTPASDFLCKEYNPLMALVYGKVYRYTDWGGECSASQSRIANELGVSTATVARRLKVLEKEGYIKRLSAKIGMTVVYVPTGKIAYKIEISETRGVSESKTPSISVTDPPTSESKTKKRIKKVKDIPPTENTKPKRKPTAYQQAITEMSEVFAKTRGCKMPDWSNNPKALNKTWGTPLGNIYRSCGRDTNKANALIVKATKKLMKDNMTFSKPVQIIDTVDSLLADQNNPAKESAFDRAVRENR